MQRSIDVREGVESQWRTRLPSGYEGNTGQATGERGGMRGGSFMWSVRTPSQAPGTCLWRYVAHPRARHVAPARSLRRA